MVLGAAGGLTHSLGIPGNIETASNTFLEGIYLSIYLESEIFYNQPPPYYY